MFDGIPILDYTPETLLGITVLLVFLGLLVPRRYYNDKVKEAKEWKEAYENEHKARELADQQTAELLELARTTHDILAAVFDKPVSVGPGRHRSSGGPHVVPTAK